MRDCSPRGGGLTASCDSAGKTGGLNGRYSRYSHSSDRGTQRAGGAGYEFTLGTMGSRLLGHGVFDCAMDDCSACVAAVSSVAAVDSWAEAGGSLVRRRRARSRACSTCCRCQQQPVRLVPCCCPSSIAATLQQQFDNSPSQRPPRVICLFPCVMYRPSLGCCAAAARAGATALLFLQAAGRVGQGRIY